MANLVNTCRDKIIGAIREVQPENRYKILVLDNESERLVANLVSHDELLRQNVTEVHRFGTGRTQQPMFEAMYIVAPKAESVDRIVADMHKQPPMYSAAHVYFTGFASDKIVERLSRSITNKSLLKCARDLTIDFYPLESGLYSLNDPQLFHMLFNPEYQNLQDNAAQLIAKKLVGLCVTMGEYPIIRYVLQEDAMHQAKTVSLKIANYLQTELDLYARMDPGFPPAPAISPLTNNPRPRALIFILDRSIDYTSPLVHEFTYQAMATDVIDIKQGKYYTYKSQGKTVQAELTQNDPIWLETRHCHMSEAINKIQKSFQEFLAENPQFRDDMSSKSSNGAGLSDMRDMLATMPHFQEMKERYAAHLALAEECMGIFEKHKLPQIGVLEQDCATGLTSEGKKPKTILYEILPILEDDTVQRTDKVRLLMLYIIFRGGVFASDLKKLISHSHLSSRDAEVIKNMSYIGAQPIRETGSKKVYQNKLLISSDKKRRHFFGETEWELSRYKPMVQQILESFFEDTLDDSIFPFTKDQPLEVTKANNHSLRSVRPNWAIRANKGVQDIQQRIFVFMAGGVTYSESRACYELAKKHHKDIIIGSDDIIVPNRWLKLLSTVKDSQRHMKFSKEESNTVTHSAPKHISIVSEQQPHHSPHTSRYQRSEPVPHVRAWKTEQLYQPEPQKPITRSHTTVEHTKGPRELSSSVHASQLHNDRNGTFEEYMRLQKSQTIEPTPGIRRATTENNMKKKKKFGMLF